MFLYSRKQGSVFCSIKNTAVTENRNTLLCHCVCPIPHATALPRPQSLSLFCLIHSHCSVHIHTHTKHACLFPYVAHWQTHMVYSPATGPWLCLMAPTVGPTYTHILAGTGSSQECSHSAQGQRKSVRMKLHYRAMRWCNYHRVGSILGCQFSLRHTHTGKKNIYLYYRHRYSNSVVWQNYNFYLFSSHWDISMHIKMRYHTGLYLFIHSSVSSLHSLYSSSHCCSLECARQAK